MVEIYEGPVRVFTQDKDGNAYVIKNGKRAGSHYCRISLTHQGETLYLPDFSNEAAGYDGQVCKVAFSQKVDAFGEPDLYNGKVQWNLDAIKPIGEAPKSAPAQVVHSDSDKDLAIRRAVALKAATETVTSLVPAITAHLEVASFDITGRILSEAMRMDAWLSSGKDIGRLDEFVAEAIDTLDASEDDESIPF